MYLSECQSGSQVFCCLSVLFMLLFFFQQKVRIPHYIDLRICFDEWPGLADAVWFKFFVFSFLFSFSISVRPSWRMRL